MWDGRKTTRRKALAVTASAAFASFALVACSSSPKPQKPFVHTTKAFDAVFGELPPMTVPGPCYATVVYFPSVREPGKYRPVPVFSAEQGKEEKLAVRTAIRGIEAGGLSEAVSFPFPPGSDLDSVSYEGDVARIKVGGMFKAATFPREQGTTAARALALTVAQFREATSVDVTDAEGKVHFGGRADQAQIADVGNPGMLGLLAIKEDKDHPPSVLSALFDRPVFVEEIAFYPTGGKSPYPGKTYSTGFGMTVELHPEHKAVFDTKGNYRVRLSVRDGKGRKISEEREWTPKEVTRE